MKAWYIHVNRHVIAANTKNGTSNPAVRIQHGKHGKGQLFHEVELPGPSKVIYSPDRPILPCGARLVIVTNTEPVGATVGIPTPGTQEEVK